MGLYVFEVLGTLLAFLPRGRLRPVVARVFGEEGPPVTALLQPRRLRQIRIDAAVVLLLFAVSGMAYGADWPFLAAMSA